MLFIEAFVIWKEVEKYSFFKNSLTSRRSLVFYIQLAVGPQTICPTNVVTFFFNSLNILNVDY